jgi:hypothetical protein
MDWSVRGRNRSLRGIAAATGLREPSRCAGLGGGSWQATEKRGGMFGGAEK